MSGLLSLRVSLFTFVVRSFVMCCLLVVCQRKRLVHDDDDKKGGGAGKSAEVKVLRKKNTELTALAKQLDDKYRALKLEHDQLVSQCLCCGQCCHPHKVVNVCLHFPLWIYLFIYYYYY